MIQKVAVIGAGRLAWSLIPNLQQAGIEVSQLISPKQESLERYQATYQIPHTSTHLRDLSPGVDLVFLAVRDEAIQEVAHELGVLDGQRIFVHSSGSVDLKELGPLGARIGVFYPLQIFTQDKITPFSQTPIFVEGEGEVKERLMALAKKLSPRTYFLSSTERMRMHLGAVMACNFTNYLYTLAQDQLPKGGDLDLSVYDPLIRNTVEKALELGPQHTQTGPAIRGDRGVLQKHLDILKDTDDVHHLYQLISQMINPELDLLDSKR